MAGEYTGAVMRDGFAQVRRALRADLLAGGRAAARGDNRLQGRDGRRSTARCMAARPSFCTGCPERPIFTAMKLVERELGPHHVSCDIGCHLFSILPPFNIGATTMGYGLGGAGRGGASTRRPTSARSLSWAMAASGTTASCRASAMPCSTRATTCIIIVDNGYSAATGGQDILSSRADNPIRATRIRSRGRFAASA